MNRVFLLLPRLDRFDAIANDVLGMRSFFRDRGTETIIVSAGGELKSDFISPGKAAGIATSEDLLIYHYGIAWIEGDGFFQAFAGKKVLRYHNVTPAHFYAPYHPGIANACEEGRRRVIELSPQLTLAVSDFNRRELLDAGWRGETVVVPPFHRVDDWALIPASGLSFEEQLQILFVGRIVPNKNLVATITVLEGALRRLGGKANLRIVGSLHSALKNYASEVKNAIAHCKNLSVDIVGRASEEKLKAYYLSSDVLVSFSEHEGFCVPVLEAMALGTAILIGQQSALEETLGASGISFTEEAVADWLSRCRSEDMGRSNARRRYEIEFSQMAINRRMELALNKMNPALRR